MQFKKRLEEIHKDWIHLLDQRDDVTNPKFLRKVALDILALDHEALLSFKSDELKDKGELVHFLLSSPWGAPFIGETTLLEAALHFDEGEADSALKHLLTDFLRYGVKQESPLFKVFDEILSQM